MNFISTGWLVFCGSYFLPRPKYPGIATEPCTAIGVLSATVVGDARPNLAANSVNRPALLHPIHPSSPLLFTQSVAF